MTSEYEYDYNDPEHECYEFNIPIFANRLPSTTTCKRPCGIEYIKHGPNCKLAEHSSKHFIIYSFAAETPGLFEERYACIMTVDLDIDPETSCSDYVDDNYEPGVMTRACICEGELCNVPEVPNGKYFVFQHA